MIAPLFFPPEAPVRRRSSHAARDATRRRKAYSRQRSYRGPMRICLISIVMVTAVVGYLFLMTRVQALDNRAIIAQTTKEQLQEDSIALQDRVAALESRDRLFSVAARMGMHEPAAFVIVNVPNAAPPVVARGTIVNTLTAWLHLR